MIWFDAASSSSVFDEWFGRIIVQDGPQSETSGAPLTTDPLADPLAVSGATFINDILVVDLNGDGRTDVTATFDRSGLSGLSNDALVWFRNTQ